MKSGGIQNNEEEMVNQSRHKLKQKRGEMEKRTIYGRGSQNNEGMVNLRHPNVKQMVRENKSSDHSIKSKNPSSIWYSGSGPGKVVFERLHSQSPSANHDRHPINKERGYLRFQDKESVIREDNVTMENQEDDQEHEVNSPRINTVTNALHQEKIASNSNGTASTRKETRALSANRKSIFNQRKMAFEIDDCAGRIVGDDSQIFITKGGCVVRECAAFDGRTWKKQPDELKEDIMSNTTEHSDYKSTCPLLARALKTQLATHHRTKQYILHKNYLKYPTKEEAMTHPPNGVKVAEWILLCDRFASEEFQKVSATNKQNRASNEVPPTVGTKSVERRIHTKRKRGKEVTAIGGYKIAHWSKKKKAMINDKATEIWIYKMRKLVPHVHRLRFALRNWVIFRDT